MASWAAVHPQRRPPIGFFLTPPVDDPRTYGIATPDSDRDGLDPMELLDAVLGTDETMEVWENELALFGWAAGQRARIVDCSSRTSAAMSQTKGPCEAPRRRPAPAPLPNGTRRPPPPKRST